MGRRSTLHAFTILILIIAVGILPGCKRTPEEASMPDQVTPGPEAQPPVETLVLPQENAEVGVSLSSLPPGLAVTLNTGIWIELTDIRDDTIQYSFVDVRAEERGPGASTSDVFEQRVRESPNGRVDARGTLDTVFGPAPWVSGTYDDDDGPVEDIHLFVPHPSGTGTLLLTSVCPRGVSTTSHRLDVMKELLNHVS